VPSSPVPVPSGELPPVIAPDPGQPPVASPPSRVTGSTVTMDGLHVVGVVELGTAAGTLRALKFTMRRVVTDDFVLRAPAHGGRSMRYVTERLTVEGNVVLYATRLVGRLTVAGGPDVPVTLTPDRPLPGGLPVAPAGPVTFRDAELDLAVITGDVLTARPALKLTLAG
jgi:hypothetical protein